MANWDKRFMDLSDHVGLWSKDKSRKLGAVIVDDENTILSIGYNGFPRGMDDKKESRYERPLKYFFTEHAERNAIFNATRSGVPLKGSKMYVRWFPCSDCARAIINSGIKTIVVTEPDMENSKWAETMMYSYEMLKECGVEIQWYADDKDLFPIRTGEISPGFYFDWNLVPYKKTDGYYERSDWYRTLVTKINMASANIAQKGNYSANKIRVSKKFDYIFDDLKPYLPKRYEVVFTEEDTNNVYVYYDGLIEGYKKKGARTKNDYAVIEITNHDTMKDDF